MLLGWDHHKVRQDMVLVVVDRDQNFYILDRVILPTGMLAVAEAQVRMVTVDLVAVTVLVVLQLVQIKL